MTTEFDVRLGFSYSLGVYLAVNALPDALLIVDGKDCVVQKVAQVQGNHDWTSNLFASDGRHRVITTHAMPEEVWKGRDEPVGRALHYAIARDDCHVVLLTAMRMASITDPAYDMMITAAAEETGTQKPTILLPTRSVRDDWLAGYADTLHALAKSLPLAARTRESTGLAVAIVGYLMDRNEEDHGANLRELGRLVEATGAHVVSTWLSGSATDRLAEVGLADVIVSLPYARDAARVLAARTGARLVETGLPMGLGGTSSWLREVGAALGRGPEAEEVIDRELRDAAPKLAWVVPMLLANRAMAFAGDPHLLRGFLSLARELGVRVPFRSIWAADDDSLDDLREDLLDDPAVVVDPREGQSRSRFDQIVAERGVQIVIGNSYALADFAPSIAMYELGFPSFHRHALTDQPFMGYRGCLSLVARLVEAIKMHELTRHG
jgi:nitrogenase molybdenum-iron protein alpha/beta subunit